MLRAAAGAGLAIHFSMSVPLRRTHSLLLSSFCGDSRHRRFLQKCRPAGGYEAPLPVFESTGNTAAGCCDSVSDVMCQMLSMNVHGPSLTSDTFMSAPNLPVSTFPLNFVPAYSTVRS